MHKLFFKSALAGLCVGALCAQDISGDWQGTLKAGQDLRIVVQVWKGDDGVWNGMFYAIDQSPDGVRASSLSLEGADVKFGLDALSSHIEGTLSADGSTIKGNWVQGLKLPFELHRATKETAWRKPESPHKTQFIEVDKNVKLEVLDWGGSGRPVVLLAGLGNSAHAFGDFAPKLAASNHVYGITRRGFGMSSVPETGYSADRLADDVLAVIEALKLDKPVLIGHSIAGEELSSIGSRHPEKVAGLIYLDAGYPYAFYDSSRGDVGVDSNDVRAKLEQIVTMAGNQKKLISELIETDLPRLENDLKEHQKDLDAFGFTPQLSSSGFSPARAVLAGEQKYTSIKAPVLAIYALPHTPPPQAGSNAERRAKIEARDLETTGAQAKAFESGVPGARVVRLAKADHYVFKSNEADVLREINSFISGLTVAAAR